MTALPSDDEVLRIITSITVGTFHHQREVGDLYGWCERTRAALTAYLDALPAADTSGLRRTLPGVSSPVMRGDNLAIVLASFFEPSIEDEELDDSGTWKQGAIDAANEVLNAIHAHYANRIEALERRLAEADATIRRFAEGNLGDLPWQANYERIRSVARSYLEGRK